MCTNAPICTQLKGQPIDLILNDMALLDDVGEVRLIQRQQPILQHRGVVNFQRRKRFACRDELQLTASCGEVIDLGTGRVFFNGERPGNDVCSYPN